MKIDWLQMVDEYWDERDTPYSDDFEFYTEWLFQYFNELPLGESIESAYLTWKSEQHRLTPKYDILSSLVPLLKHYILMGEEDNQFKITFQCCNGFVTCKGGSVELLYITFLNAGLSTLRLYPEALDQQFSTFGGLPRQKYNVCIISF